MSFQLRRLLLFVLAGVLVVLGAQSISAQTINISENHANVDQLTIGDLDFENFGSQHWFFTLNVRSSLSVGEARLFVNVDVDLPSASYHDAVTFTTLPFSLPMTMTNMDIGKDGSVKLEPGSFQFNNEAKEKIKNIALSTGRVPAGTYRFKLKAVNVLNPTDLDETEIVITIQNFSRVELLSPANQSDIPTTFPLFQWQYDGDQVELAVYEKMPQHQSVEEALTGTPYLVVRSGDPGFPAGVRSYQYPSTGVRALEEGKTYVWIVRALQHGSGGSEIGLNSEIWQFTVTSTGELGNNPPQRFRTTEEVAELLREIPGIDAGALKKLIEENQLTGDVYLNGQKISIAELKQLLDELLANPDRIIEMKVTNE